MSDLIYAPPPFFNRANHEVRFVDFTHARYRLEFDAEAHEATACSEITFEADKQGLVAISLNQPYTSAALDGLEVALDQEFPDIGDLYLPPGKKPSVKVLSRAVCPGVHVLTIKSCISDPGPYGCPIRWLSDPACVDCIFNMSDIQRDGGYLEAFLPSNYNFDHFRMSFDVTIKNSREIHSVFTNGTKSKLSSRHWKVEFPDYFTSSCPWFHFGPADDYQYLRDYFVSSDKRKIPVLVYTKSGHDADRTLKTFVRNAKVHLCNLECDFGPFPHESLVIYARLGPPSGMEYAGAVATELGALRHELDHSYFGRSVIPVDGAAGWIDEAIAKWGDCGYPRSERRPVRRVNMGKRSPYVRTTSNAAYSTGRDFLAHLDHVVRDCGGLKRFLKEYAKQKRHQSVTATEFQQMMVAFYCDQSEDLWKLFGNYVYFGHNS